MRQCLVVMLACGCAGSGTPSAPDVNGFDLVISSTYVRVFVHFDAAVTGGAASVPHLPDVGACAALDTDTALLITTKLDSVAIDGLPLSNGSPDPDKQVTSPYTSYPGVTVDTMFRATDADVSIAVPIHAGGYPAATDVHAQQQGTDVLATWTAPAADSVLVGDAGGFGLESCHRPPSSQFVLAGGAGGANEHVEVQPLAAPEVTDTELGAVRVYYGEIAMAPITP